MYLPYLIDKQIKLFLNNKLFENGTLKKTLIRKYNIPQVTIHPWHLYKG